MMKTQIKKIHTAISKLNFPENQDLLKEFLEQKYKQELIKAFQNEGISINLLRNKSIKKTIFSILGGYIAKNIILKEIPKDKLIENFFYNNFLNKIKVGDNIGIILYWQNIIKSYKEYIQKEVELFFTNKNIKISQPFLEGISTYFIKTDLDTFFSKLVGLIINELGNRGKNYQKLIFFLTNYFSGLKIYIGQKKYKLPTISLFSNGQLSLISQIKKIADIKDKKNKLIKKLEKLQAEKNNLTQTIEQNKKELEDLEKLLQEIKKENIKISKRISQIKSIINPDNKIKRKNLIGPIRDIGPEKDTKKLKQEQHKLLMKLGSNKEKIKNITHNIFIGQLNLKGLEKKLEQIDNEINKTKHILEELIKKLKKIKSMLITNLKKLPKEI